MLAEVLSAASVFLSELLDVNLLCKLVGVIAVPSLVVVGAKRMGLPYFDTSLDTGDQRRATPKEWNEIKNCTREEEYVQSSSGTLLYVQTFLPVGAPRAVVVFLHGYGDHTGFFKEKTFGKILDAGFAVLAMDMAGHGRSDGLHAYVPSFSAMIKDVADVIKMAKANQLRQPLGPNLKYFSWGESMGGGACIMLALNHPGAVEGAVMVAPMCRISDKVKPPALLTKLLVWLSGMFPTWPVTPIADITYKCFHLKEILLLVEKNPLLYRKLPRLATANQMLRATETIQARMEDVTFPFCVVHGKEDVVTDPECSIELFNRARTDEKRKKLGIYENCWHGITFEPEENVKQMWLDVFSWLEDRLQEK